ncbi:MAG TPA: tRNA preQ1(34) S-adenosylmethionine ribosyltransferase-isomerase QueA [Alphaproteobacteria bacterium]|nr:tRNA preQ1(34) S-adenosylmethionine ribosyltransferase-isomerase QueA [Alphaproteobacteria bacterium]
MGFTLTDFDYHLPEGLIAHTAAEPRDSARLLRWPEGAIGTVADLPEFLNKGDLLVVNTSKVIPARLHGVRKARLTGHDVEVEILLHQSQTSTLEKWTAFARPGRRLKEGDVILLPADATATIESKQPDGQITITLHTPGHVAGWLEKHGHTPLPPYIHADDSQAVRARYQTVYADAHKPGSVAAPTAGLHFTPELLAKLKGQGVNIAHVTLHVGAGTFLNPTDEQVQNKKLHPEFAHLPPETAQAIVDTKKKGGKVIAVGTTATRTLESWALAGSSPEGFMAPTTLFIQPGFEFKVVDKLMTNFHLPQTSLLMLVAAFVGPSWAELYQTAMANNLRFYSFGDSSLLTKYGT